MVRVCLYFAVFGIGFALLLYVAVKLRWRIAGPMHRHAPRVATAAAAVLLLMYVMTVTAGTSDWAEAFGKSLKQAEYTLRDWFNALRGGSG
jgi:cytochrome b561